MTHSRPTTHDPIFWDVDTQHDFMRADGRLYVGDSESIIPVLGRLTAYAHGRGIRIVASADDHEPGHRELSDAPDFAESFPEHCMRGTAGQRKIPEPTLLNPCAALIPEQAPESDAWRRVEWKLQVCSYSETISPLL